MENENQQSQPAPQPQYQQTVVVVTKQKSVGTAFLLAFLFGPLGLLYASVTGGIVMFILGILIALITFGFGIIFVWIGCIIWAVVAAGNANKKAGVNINTNFTGQQPARPTQPIQQKYSQPQQQVASEINNPRHVAEAENQSSVAPEKEYRPTKEKAQPPQSSFDLAKWFDVNKKSVFIGAGGVVGLLILIVAVKYVASLDFGKSKSNTEITQSKQPAYQENLRPEPQSTSSPQTPQQTTTEQQNYQDNLVANNHPTSSGIYPQASERLLTRNDVLNLSKYQLKIMRNEIFARHGYIFKTPDMKYYFSQQSWYHGQYSDVNSMLSVIEKQNIELIRKHE